MRGQNHIPTTPYDQIRETMRRNMPHRGKARCCRETGVPLGTLKAFARGERRTMPIAHLAAIARYCGFDLRLEFVPRAEAQR